MTPHAKVYMKYFEYGETENIPCEACGSPSVDIHHIRGRGEGMDSIKNLMALCRKHHNAAHSNISKDEMQLIHGYFMSGSRKVFLT
jgi:hypothetical protein